MTRCRSLLWSAILLTLALPLSSGCERDAQDPTGPAPDRATFGSVDGTTQGLAAQPTPELAVPVVDPEPIAPDPFLEPHEAGILVVLRKPPADPLAKPQSSEAAAASYGATFEGLLTDASGLGYEVYGIPASTDLRTKSAELLNTGDFSSVDPAPIYFMGHDIILTFYESSGLQPLAEDAAWQSRCNLSPMQGLIATSTTAVTVAVLDGGVDASLSPELASRLSSSGYDYVGHDSDPRDEPGGVASGHGTLVADLIHQVTPSATILPLRVMNPDGVAKARDIARGIRYARNHGATVINMSFGGSRAPQFLERIFKDSYLHGVVLVGSVGNSGSLDETHFPSSSAWVIAVGSTDANDQRAAFSSYARHIDIAAPGDGISGLGLPSTKNRSLGVGTSFSTAMISGAVAARIAKNPGYSVQSHFSALVGGEIPLLNDSIYNSGYFAGRIDFAAYVSGGAN